MSDTPDGSAQDIESKLKALELDFDLDSKIKQIEDDLVSKEAARDRKISEMHKFLESSAQTFNSAINNSTINSQTTVGESS